jgi:hypothetical protein
MLLKNTWVWLVDELTFACNGCIEMDDVKFPQPGTIGKIDIKMTPDSKRPRNHFLILFTLLVD